MCYLYLSEVISNNNNNNNSVRNTIHLLLILVVESCSIQILCFVLFTKHLSWHSGIQEEGLHV